MIPKGTTHVFWKTVEAGARAAAADLDVELVWKGPLKENDRGQQIAIVEQFVTEGVSAIILAPLDAVALRRPVAMAAQRKIPVVIFDSALQGEAGKDYVSLVATDNRRGGELGGAKLGEVVADGEGAHIDVLIENSGDKPMRATKLDVIVLDKDGVVAAASIPQQELTVPAKAKAKLTVTTPLKPEKVGVVRLYGSDLAR
jgi:ABC-type sugar transport system substrate-binding protein